MSNNNKMVDDSLLVLKFYLLHWKFYLNQVFFKKVEYMSAL